MKATSHDTTLCLNQSNHPSVPAEGLVLEAGKATPVPSEMKDYLQTLGVQVQNESTATPKPSAIKAPKE